MSKTKRRSSSRKTFRHRRYGGMFDAPAPYAEQPPMPAPLPAPAEQPPMTQAPAAQPAVQPVAKERTVSNLFGLLGGRHSRRGKRRGGSKRRSSKRRGGGKHRHGKRRSNRHYH